MHNKTAVWKNCKRFKEGICHYFKNQPSWLKTEPASCHAWIEKVKELYQMEKIITHWGVNGTFLEWEGIQRNSFYFRSVIMDFALFIVLHHLSWASSISCFHATIQNAWFKKLMIFVSITSWYCLYSNAFIKSSVAVKKN